MIARSFAFGLLLVFTAIPTIAQEARVPEPFQTLTPARADGSEARIFVDETRLLEGASDAAAPLLVYVEGSGAQSLFYRLDDGRIAMGIFGLIAERTRSEYVVASIDKRGVEFGDMGTRGIGEGASEEYTRHATLENRAADVRLLLSTLLEGGAIDPKRVVLLGHSEGADVVARVAAEDERVTHVAFLSGGGCAQFYDMFLTTRRVMRESGASDEEIEKRMSELEDDVRKIVAKPESDTDFFQGHAYRRWASFATQAAADSLVRTKARLFLGHGTADESVPIESFDYLVVRLLCAQHKDVTVRRFPNRDHSFIEVGSEPGYEGFLSVVDEVVEWARD